MNYWLFEEQHLSVSRLFLFLGVWIIDLLVVFRKIDSLNSCREIITQVYFISKNNLIVNPSECFSFIRIDRWHLFLLYADELDELEHT
jgi:hypothetical protein